MDFKKELKRYGPILEIENLEDDVAECDAKDIMEMLAHLTEARGEANGSKT